MLMCANFSPPSRRSRCLAPPPARRSPPSRPSATGGEVVRAWPADGTRGKPDGRLARFLARQVGPRRSRGRCGAPPTPDARIAQAPTVPGAVLDVVGQAQALPRPLLRHPGQRPARGAAREPVWTYDSAVSAVALTASGRAAQARQLLDQLAALQRTDGSLDFAYDTATGATVQLFRTGTIAWVGYAALLQQLSPRTARTTRSSHGTARWLLARQLAQRAAGGWSRRARWASTQHNLVAYQFLAALATQPGRQPSRA